MQRRLLIRARDLASFRNALVDLALEGPPLAARRRTIVVPTRAAGMLLRLTIEQRAAAGGALICPEIVTREEWLAGLATTLPGPVRWLSRIERVVLLERALETTLARRRGLASPFELRPGLVAAVLDFYDELRRRRRRIRAFARTIFDELRVERGTDRGSEGLIEQTRLLGLAFLEYERLARVGGGVDEHELRVRLLAEQPDVACRDLVVAVADHPADLRGLWPADFDLIGRLGTVTSVRVVMTDEAHDAGFRARVEAELPGIEEARAADSSPARAPMLVETSTDARTDSDVPVSLSRDREEELRQVARHLRTRAHADGHLPGPTAIVFHRPLPYLYLAQQVLTDARVPFQAFDTLPLAVEPYAALVDLALAVARTGGARDAVLALLRSPLASFAAADGTPVTPRDVQALELVLTEARVDGPAAGFARAIAAWQGNDSRRASRAARARRAAEAGLAAAERLAGCTDAPASAAAATLAAGDGEEDGSDRREQVSGGAADQVRCLARFIRDIERRDEPGRTGRFGRARAAVLGVLDGVADALGRVGYGRRALDDIAALIYHALEQRTFAPEPGRRGVHLVDAASARFGEFDDVYLVGLVETDWAERPRRNFFYSAGLLRALGWPQEADQVAAQQAAFRDVLSLARHRTRLSAFQLDGETVVGLATILDEAAKMQRVREEAPEVTPLFADEILTTDLAVEGLDANTAMWLRLRRDRALADEAAYSGLVEARAPDVYRVSQIDRYVSCPFRYFAQHVLRLEEERREGVGLTPLERGSLIHSLLEQFYRRWQDEGHGAVTTANLPEAHALFADVTEAALAGLPAADRDLERLRIAGSIVGPGVADRVLEFEASSQGEVRRRILEEPIEGTFTFPLKLGLATRPITIRGKADRIDVLHDGRLRVIDYKLGRAPDAESLQAAVYAWCVKQLLQEREGRQYGFAAALYLSFGESRQFANGIKGAEGEVEAAVAARAGEFATVVERIEAGQFPARPVRVSLCVSCGVAGVCRKEYQRVEDDAAEPV